MLLQVRDRSRQWVTPKEPLSSHHKWRYILAGQVAKGRTLDAACGCGYGTGYLHYLTGEAVGVDYNADAIAWAKGNFPGPQYLHGRIEDAPWVGGFQTIVSLETIEHMKEPLPALKVLRKSCIGKLVASVPNQNLYPFVAANFANDDSPHFRHYTPEEFEILLNEAGFEVSMRFCQKSKLEPEIVEGTNGRFLVYVCS